MADNVTQCAVTDCSAYFDPQLVGPRITGWVYPAGSERIAEHIHRLPEGPPKQKWSPEGEAMLTALQNYLTARVQSDMYWRELLGRTLLVPDHEVSALDSEASEIIRKSGFSEPSPSHSVSIFSLFRG